jgi:hypothetical protein
VKFRLANNPQQGAQSLGGGIGAAIQAFMSGDQVRQQAADEAMDTQAKRDLVGAQSRAALAQSGKYDAETAQIGDQRTRASFPELLKAAAFQFGVPTQAMPDLEQVINTGQLPSQYQPPADGRGPVMPVPDFLSPASLAKIRQTVGGTNQALAVGDKSVENIAKAAQVYQSMGLRDQSIKGQVSPLVLAQTNFAMSGDAPFKPNEYGVTNLLTGAVDTNNPAAQTFGRLRQSEIGENNSTTARNLAEYGKTTRETQFVGQQGVPGATSKPLPTPALKMQNEALEGIGIAGGISADISKIQQQIDGGALDFGPVSNIMNQGLNMAGISTEQSRNFASFKSTLEKLRNDSLRLNTGVQTDGDAQRAWNELFQNITDKEFVKQRLAEIQQINARGVELKKLQVDSIRANFGAAPYDFGAVSAASGAPAQPAGGKIMNMADVEATAQRSGRSVQDVIKAAQSKGFTVR